MLDSLHHLILIVELGTFTAAARAAHLTQPALSASIKRLEEAMGGQLLHRGPGGARLTAAGEALLPRARAALVAVADGRRAVSEVLGLRVGEVRLGAGPTAATYLLPPYFARFRAAFPGVRFFLREAHSPAIWEGLRRGDLDLGLVADDGERRDERWIVAEPCLRDELVIAAAPGLPHPESAPWVTFPPGSSLRAVLEQRFGPLDVVMELASIAAVKGNVRAGIGRCLISRDAIAQDVADGRLVEVPHPATPLRRQLLLVHRGTETLAPAAARLRELLLA